MRKHPIKVHGKLLIFGGAGSLGTELVRFYRKLVDEIVVVSRDEAKHWELKNLFGTRYKRGEYYRTGFSYVPVDELVEEWSTLRTLICDVRDSRRVHQVIRDESPDYIIIAQALKQVDTCEAQPSESIDTNILGVRNILDAIEENNSRSTTKCPTVCFVSTDKACNPVNVYGMCKSISERMVATLSKTSKSRYVTTRYGNVISSKGSLIPLFLKQAQSPDFKAFTVTDSRMTRFMMLLGESVQLIDDALTYGSKGDLWIPNLDSFNVMDLAEYFSQKYGKPIKLIGARPGEKIHELLMSEEEMLRAVPFFGRYVVNDSQELRKEEAKEYSSKDCVVSRQELSKRLDEFLEKGEYVKTVQESSGVGSQAD